MEPSGRPAEDAAATGGEEVKGVLGSMGAGEGAGGAGAVLLGLARDRGGNSRTLLCQIPSPILGLEAQYELSRVCACDLAGTESRSSIAKAGTVFKVRGRMPCSPGEDLQQLPWPRSI